MKSLFLLKQLLIVGSTELRQELHQIIDRIEDNKILEAAYTLLEKQDVALHMTNGNALTQKEFESKIDEGEINIEQSQVYSHEQVKAHFRDKRG